MINQVAVLISSIRYEFLMQLRRRSLWIAMVLVGFFQLFMYITRASVMIEVYNRLPLVQAVAELAVMLNFLLPAAFGCLLADRLPRDRRTKVEEIFNATPGALSIRLLGKYLGSMSATCIPYLLFYCFGVGFVLYLTGNVQTLPVALAVLIVAILPGILFISAFSIACPAFIWVPLYQFCFVGYWFWGNLLSPHEGIPTLSSTILTPSGKFIVAGIFQLSTDQPATQGQGIASIAVLSATAILVLIMLWRGLKWQQARQ